MERRWIFVSLAGVCVKHVQTQIMVFTPNIEKTEIMFHPLKILLGDEGRNRERVHPEWVIYIDSRATWTVISRLGP